ncbi:P-loop containing nucleoside triphosphate hydrolase protein [Hypoxylon trugodes]|uniref:P-loop containing nucleoside triphosphate hydrolase protein n=1 Tax=Hypoxylon trugodes TaxID=326681 RepID=UPI0021A1A221|nr:P-loop containing nucleoside triphosphate hydrolase protein [Hypoxylon trugodes]KAI1383064.1 P-loop containing nucleoside triphosphate hydrolase protein [Hypoxylon trugodes]
MPQDIPQEAVQSPLRDVPSVKVDIESASKPLTPPPNANQIESDCPDTKNLLIFLNRRRPRAPYQPRQSLRHAAQPISQATSWKTEKKKLEQLAIDEKLDETEDPSLKIPIPPIPPQEDEKDAIQSSQVLSKSNSNSWTSYGKRVCKKQERNLDTERFNIVFQGNPGTGKTTVARLFAEFLYSIGVIGSDSVMETSGIVVAENDVKWINEEIDEMIEGGGGVLFIDEAYQLTAPYVHGGGRRALDAILTKMENNIGKLVVIFVGYRDEMESFFEHNPGLTSRIPYSANFADFTDWELWKILSDLITKQYKGNMKIEGGASGLYMRVAIRRLAQMRGYKGFGNAREVENLLARIADRQAKRLDKERTLRLNLDYFYFTKEDLIGPDQSRVSNESTAWAEMQDLVGLEQVKEYIARIIRMIKMNYRRELNELNPLKFSLNRLFVGAPGTGKTTMAKLYGRILADFGYLSRGDVVLKNPADFIGECLGKSEAKTKKILDSTIGKVLVIDEAYVLDVGDPGRDQDKFKSGVLDTIVSMVQGVPGEDRCIILVGYEDRIRTMFRNANPGLARRFPTEMPYQFGNFGLQQLQLILEKKLREQDLSYTTQAAEATSAMFERALMRPNFTNAGEVDRCLDIAKLKYEQRQSELPEEKQDFRAVLEAVDFDPDWDRSLDQGQFDCRVNLQGRVHGRIVDQLSNYQKRYLRAKQLHMDPRRQIPTNFVFKGPSGTGKTTTAQQMGKVFYGMGFLSTSEVIECSASDLLGEYVGHKREAGGYQCEGGAHFIPDSD